jgi:hypothetical protein
LKKKKAKEAAASLVSQRHDKDEVWKSIKQFLKNNDEYGHEIADSFVVKKNVIDYINPKLSHYRKSELNTERKIRTLLTFKGDKKNKKAEPFRDLYLVFFTTRDTKLNKLHNSRCIECEVLTIPVSKKETEKKIVILGEKNYEKEIQWVAPLKEAEEKRNFKTPKQELKEKKYREKLQKKQEKKIQKIKNKS